MKQFKILNNTFGWLTFIIAAATYCMTVEPTASFWDCPEFILSGNKLEVGHPPGAPFFMLTANFFSMFAGPQKVALMVNIMSAILSALGILFLFWSITHLARKLIVGNSNEMSKAQMVTILASGVVGALAYTWSDTYWFSAVEGEVYGYSSLFTAVVFWLILKWEDSASSPHSDRWLILIAYLVGLSIGVHLLNLLCIPAIVLVVYYKKFPNANFKGSLLALVVSAVLVAVVLYGIVPGVVKVGGWFELLFVNVLEMPFNTGLIIYMILLAAVLICGVFLTEKDKSQKSIAAVFTAAVALLGIPFYGHNVTLSIIIGIAVLAAIYIICTYSKKVTSSGKAQGMATTANRYIVSKRAFNTAFLSLLLIMVGYSSYALIVIRSSANTPMDQNSPEDIFTLGTYLSREQYGTRPLFYGQAFDSEIKIDKEKKKYSSTDTSPIYSRVEKKEANEPDRYEIIGYNKEYNYVQNMFFPRMYSSDHAQQYEQWIGGPVKNIIRAENAAYTGVQYIKMPTQLDNMKFFINYQVNYMYWRYFLWNFVGRQNDIQGKGEAEHGNWITGVPFIDKALIGNSQDMPQQLRENKGHNVFFALPLILGILGILWQWNRGKEGKQQLWTVFMLFFMTGLAIVLYLNQTPDQPRERDYAYAGSFYAFAIWIGLGVAGIADFIQRQTKKESLAANIAVAVACLAVPVQMVSQTWDDHDRSGRYACRDFGQNYLNTLPDDGSPIIFTCGDNDTFPLWYCQEVEQERTDARVCNLSYLQTDWYIDQMRRPAYDSPSLPITMKRIDYAGNANGSIEILDKSATALIEKFFEENPEKAKVFGKNPFEMNNISRYWIYEADAKEKSEGRLIVEEAIEHVKAELEKQGREIEERGRSEYNKLLRNKAQYLAIVSPEEYEMAKMQAEEYIEYGGYFIENARSLKSKVIPSSVIYIPIDAEAVKRSGMMIPEEYKDEMPEYMKIDLGNKEVLLRYEFVIFDMLANANWERPIYMSMTVGDSNYPAVLQNFFIHEGLAYRISPFDWKELGYYNGESGHPVDVERFYDNIMNRFKWGEVKNNKNYYADETIRRMIYTHRNLIAMLTQVMMNKKVSDEMVFNVLEKWHSEFPAEIVPYDAVRDNSIAVAAAYKILHDRARSNDIGNTAKERYVKIASDVLKDQLEYLRWYNGLRTAQRNELLIYTRLNIITQAINLLGGEELDGFSIEELVSELAKSIDVECKALTKTNSKLLSNNTAVDRKLQLIDFTYDILSSFADVPSADSRIAAMLKNVCNFENRTLKKYNVNRLNESSTEEIIASLQIMTFCYKMAGKLPESQNDTFDYIEGIYGENVEKFAPYVLNN
ncbi:MAG: DUF2723 domain-containing protein [Bacteroidaceae bacterium]|nr:DUF2723 domain-containing protein [Bacteroidaceae bacterium]